MVGCESARSGPLGGEIRGPHVGRAEGQFQRRRLPRCAALPSAAGPSRTSCWPAASPAWRSPAVGGRVEDPGEASCQQGRQRKLARPHPLLPPVGRSRHHSHCRRATDQPEIRETAGGRSSWCTAQQGTAHATFRRHLLSSIVASCCSMPSTCVCASACVSVRWSSSCVRWRRRSSDREETARAWKSGSGRGSWLILLALKAGSSMPREYRQRGREQDLQIVAWSVARCCAGSSQGLGRNRGVGSERPVVLDALTLTKRCDSQACVRGLERRQQLRLAVGLHKLHRQANRLGTLRCGQMRQQLSQQLGLAGLRKPTQHMHRIVLRRLLRQDGLVRLRRLLRWRWPILGCGYVLPPAGG